MANVSAKLANRAIVDFIISVYTSGDLLFMFDDVCRIMVITLWLFHSGNDKCVLSVVVVNIVIMIIMSR